MKKTLNKAAIKYTASVSFLLLFLLVAFNLNSNSIKNIDNSMYLFVISFESNILTTIFIIITNMVNPIFIILVITCILILIKNKKIVIPIILNSLITTTLFNILKHIIVRPRPNIHRLIHASGYSFPSGHSLTAFTFYGYLFYLVYKKKFKLNTKIRKALLILIPILILLIGISRIYLGVHYFSDVIGAFLLSISYLIIFINVTKKVSLSSK